MNRHIAVLAILAGVFYLLIRYAGLKGAYMVCAPVLFLIYIAVEFLFIKKLKRKKAKKNKP